MRKLQPGAIIPAQRKPEARCMRGNSTQTMLNINGSRESPRHDSE